MWAKYIYLLLFSEHKITKYPFVNVMSQGKKALVGSINYIFFAGFSY